MEREDIERLEIEMREMILREEQNGQRGDVGHYRDRQRLFRERPPYDSNVERLDYLKLDERRY